MHAHEIKSSRDITNVEPDYNTAYWGVVDFEPVPPYFIDTHDPKTQDRYISASVHENKEPWDSFIWDRIVSLSPPDAGGLVFVDVGANIGYFSLAAAALGYNVISFEPMSRNARKLVRSVEQNQFNSRVTVYQNAVTEQSGQLLTLKETDSTNQGNGMIVSYNPGRWEYGVDYVASVTLSTLLIATDAHIVKIDVEGYENKALWGAKSWICNNVVRHIIMEVSDATRKSTNPSLSEVLDFMKSAGYSISDVAVGSEELKNPTPEQLPPNIVFTLVSSHPTC